MLCGIYIGLGIIGISLILFFLDDISHKTAESKQSDENVENTNKKKSFKGQLVHIKSTFLHMKKRNQLLVIPITCWLGFEQGFLGAEFTKSFVACSQGVNYVGLTMICFGVTDTLGSYAFGLMAKYVGRIPCFIVPVVLNYAMLILMLVWVPKPNETFVLFLIPVFWGLADAGWQTQINC